MPLRTSFFWNAASASRRNCASGFATCPASFLISASSLIAASSSSARWNALPAADAGMELRAKDARVTSAATQPTRNCANMGLVPPSPSGGNFRGGDHPSTIPNHVRVVTEKRRTFVGRRVPRQARADANRFAGGGIEPRSKGLRRDAKPGSGTLSFFGFAFLSLSLQWSCRGPVFRPIHPLVMDSYEGRVGNVAARRPYLSDAFGEVLAAGLLRKSVTAECTAAFYPVHDRLECRYVSPEHENSELPSSLIGLCKVQAPRQRPTPFLPPRPGVCTPRLAERRARLERCRPTLTIQPLWLEIQPRGPPACGQFVFDPASMRALSQYFPAKL